MFLYHYSRLPITFVNYFVTSSAVHKYSTRSYHSLKYYIPAFLDYKNRLNILEQKYGITLI